MSINTEVYPIQSTKLHSTLSLSFFSFYLPSPNLSPLPIPPLLCLCMLEDFFIGLRLEVGVVSPLVTGEAMRWILERRGCPPPLPPPRPMQVYDR